jgi:hypothetical protein
MAALSAIPIVGALGKGMAAGGRFLAAHGDDYLTAAQRFAKEKPLEAGFVTIAPPAEGERVFLTAQGKAGFKLAPNEDGTFDIRGLFNHGTKGDGTVGLVEAVRAGGATLDNYDTPLSRIYDAAGFKTTERFPFDASQSTLDPSFGTPDYTMRRLDPEYAAAIKDPSKTAEQVAAEINAARKQGLDILGRPLAEVTGARPRPAAGVELPPGLDKEIIKQGGLLSADKIDKMYGGDVLPGDVTGLFPAPKPGELPAVRQGDIPRAQPGTARTKALAEELRTEIAKGLIDSPRVRELVETRPELKDWYDSMQSVRKSFYDEFRDPADAEARFRRFVRYNTAQSPGTPVPRQIRQASYDHYQEGQGLLQGRLDARGRGVEPGFSPLYPASAAKQTQMVVDDVPFNGPKLGGFDENNFGNKIPFTGDTHASTDTRRALEHRPDLQELIPVEGSVPADWRYGATEKGWQDAGEHYGMTASELQALTWVGNGDINGLKSGVEPALELYARRVVMTAKHMAKVMGRPDLDSPEGFKAIWRAVQNKEIPLLGVGGLLVGGAAATQTAPDQGSGGGPRGLL